MSPALQKTFRAAMFKKANEPLITEDVKLKEPPK
jgi:hypothetical protein